ncbi:hypothetical protein ASF61_14190 [Duganella sp. Leaf126]|uniref:M50 family metallopeptidase n=1 Tax=Duganella sp. Leaf126 TaxID=1736266 RepID=UPI0006FC3587|nr:M50 family metallopeptidase [Duganella sp. Leaf126]KQQ32686.1 hypothetical protein ASF61_14190 [Duganella sp. Leaf126]
MNAATAGAPLVNAELEFEPAVDGKCVVYDRRQKKYFRMGMRETGFLRSLDGARSAEQLCLAPGDFTAAQVRTLLDWFASNGMLHDAVRAAAPKPLLERLAAVTDAKLVLWNPDAFLDRHRPLIAGLFGLPARAACLAICLLPMLLFVLAPRALDKPLQAYMYQLDYVQAVLVLVIMLLIVAGHELSHAVVCKYFGGAVEAVGISFLYLAPIAYCDVSATWRLPSTGAKVAVALAGVVFQLLLSCLLLSAWIACGVDLLMTLAIINSLIALLNLFPFVKLDGYWIAVYLSGLPNLHQRAVAAAWRRAARLVGLGALTSAKPADEPAWLPWFGLGATVAVPAFWLMGLFNIYRWLAPYSPLGASVLAALAVVLLAYRGVRQATAHLHQLRKGVLHG